MALKALEAAKTTSPLVRECQKALDDISTSTTVRLLYWVPGHAGVQGNEIADKLTREGSVQKFIGPEVFLGGVLKQNIKDRWVDTIIWQCGVVLVVLRDILEN